MKTCLVDQRGSGIATVMMLMVVLALLISGMLQVAAMSFRTGLFEEQRQQALCAAESGVNVAIAALNAGVAIPTGIYPENPPSIDSTTMPELMDTGNETLFKVWITKPVDGKRIITSLGRSGKRTRIIETKVTTEGFAPPLTYLCASAEHTAASLMFTGAVTIKGRVRTESNLSNAVSVDGAVSSNDTLTVGKGANVKKIQSSVGRAFKKVEVASSEMRYPLPIPPDNLPDRGAFNKNEANIIQINDSGRYSSFKVAGASIIEVDTTPGDIVWHITGDFEMEGASILKINGSNALRIYIDGDVKGVGAGITNMTADPTRFIIYSRGKHVNLNGAQSCCGVVYAPNALIEFKGAGGFTGAAVGGRIGVHGAASMYWPQEPYAQKLRELNLGVMEDCPVLAPGSWRELPPLGKDKMKSD